MYDKNYFEEECNRKPAFKSTNEIDNLILRGTEKINKSF